MPSLTRTDDALEVTLKGYKGDFKEALAKIKAIPGRRYDPERKVWMLPNEVTVAQRIMHTIRPSASPEVLAWVREAAEEQAAELTTNIPDDAELQLPWADALMAHQRSAVEHAVAKEPRLLIADDMGLGKTVQSIATYEEYLLRTGQERKLSIVVCPKAVRGGWRKTAEGWLGFPAMKVWDGIPVQVLDAKTAAKRDEQIAEANAAGALLVMNWEKLRMASVRDTLVRYEPEAVYADEVHRGKNRKAQQTQGLWKMQAHLQLGLSGTPIMNSPDELWAILRWLYPDQYNRHGRNGAVSYWRFYDQYVEYYEGPWGKVITGVRNPDALRFELQNRMVRRTKKQVLDLPGKVREMLPLDLNPKQRKLYDEAEKELWFQVAQEAKDGDKQAAKLLEAAFDAPAMLYEVPNGAARTVRLRQIACTPATLGGEDDSAKLDAAEELILDAQPKQFVTFCEFRPGAAALAKRLTAKGLRAATFMGGDEYEELETKFQDGEIDVLCCTIAAGGVGINLSAADTQIWIDRDWRPAINSQGEDRSDRQGQVNKVTIIILQANNTVDTKKVQPANDLKDLIVSSILPQDHIEETDHDDT